MEWNILFSWIMMHQIESFLNEAFCIANISKYHDMGKVWMLTLHTLYHIFYVEQRNHKHQCMLDLNAITYFIIQIITCTWHSHTPFNVRPDIRAQLTSDKTSQLCTFSPLGHFDLPLVTFNYAFHHLRPNLILLWFL